MADPFVLFVIGLTLLIGFGGVYIHRHGRATPLESMSPTRSMLEWHRMSEREHLVWASCYANDATPSAKAVRRADRSVIALRQLDLDSESVGPELSIVSTGVDLAYEEFRLWYPIALKLALTRWGSYLPPNEIQCQEAYERYQRSKSDFY